MWSFENCVQAMKNKLEFCPHKLLQTVVRVLHM